MATQSEYQQLCRDILDNNLITEQSWSTPFSLGQLRANKGAATKKNLNELFSNASSLSGHVASAIAASFADSYHGQKNICFGIILAIPPSVLPGNQGDVDNYANAICDMMVELFRATGSFDGDPFKMWDDAQIKDLRIIKVTSWDQNWWVSVTTGTSLAPT